MVVLPEVDAKFISQQIAGMCAAVPQNMLSGMIAQHGLRNMCRKQAQTASQPSCHQRQRVGEGRPATPHTALQRQPLGTPVVMQMPAHARGTAQAHCHQ